MLDGAPSAQPGETPSAKRVRELESELEEWRARQRRELSPPSDHTTPAPPGALGGAAVTPPSDPDFAELRPSHAAGVSAAQVIEAIEAEMGSGGCLVDVIAARTGAPPPSKSGFGAKASPVVRHAAIGGVDVLSMCCRCAVDVLSVRKGVSL